MIWSILFWVGIVYVVAGWLTMAYYALFPGPGGQAMPAGCWTAIVFPVHWLIVGAVYQVYDWLVNAWSDPPKE